MYASKLQGRAVRSEKNTTPSAPFHLILPLLIGMVLFTGCESPPSAGILERASAHSPVYLAAGDVVKLSFPGAPEFNQAQKIRSDGQISLPVIGEVQASGKRLVTFQNELSGRYKDQLQNTDVLVTLESSASPVLVSGAVNKPGKIAFERPLTVLDAIMEAGGIAPIGDARRVHLIRLSNGQHQTQVFDMRPILRGQSSRAYYVKGGDVIYVEESIF